MITALVLSGDRVLGYLLLADLAQAKGWAKVERYRDVTFQALKDNSPARVTGLRRLN